MSKPLVAIVGRPNVGKSLLFNRLSGHKLSIVDDQPGVTRDRIYADCRWHGRDFILIDTGGIEPHTDDEMLRFMREQANVAIDSADVIIFITDLSTGVTAADEDVAAMLQRCGKPVVLCVNKVDAVGDPPAEFYEFYSLGFGDPIALSALHGHGTGDLLDACVSWFGPEEAEEEEPDRIRVAVIGKPNAGKSSLVNYILGENRVIVSPVAGTTRDAIDTAFENEYGKYTIIDTAGMRRKARVGEDIEKYSVIRGLMAIERSDVCLIMVDAVDGVTEQDTKIAGLAHEKGKAAIIVINKWDLVDKDDKTMQKFEEKIRTQLAYMAYAPIVFISAKTGQRVDKLFTMINDACEMNSLRIPTGALNEVLRDAVMRVQPPTDRGKRLKVYYMTQVGVKPPHFVLFCNNAELFHFSYKRYIENCIRASYGLMGT
ncbi:MAG: ribosome biogenesis GTPase Der, partial [Oscillospiraceae bacterium]|nr:ribosome biogenesis GTPase Der [Oscillospiraceae bacterium]